MDTKVLNQVLDQFKTRQRRRSLKFREKHRKMTEESNKRTKRVKLLLQGKTVRASKRDYEKWLAGYLSQGGKPTHSYNYDMPEDRWFVATKDFQIEALHGSDSLQIIVKSGVIFEGGELGHTNLYFMDDFKLMGGWVPVYSNIKF